jgi:hypothetical protein
MGTGRPTGRPKKLPGEIGPKAPGGERYATARDLAARFKSTVMWVERRLRDPALAVPFP